jgi:hypothetical protein
MSGTWTAWTAWVAGMRAGKLYTIARRPVDPRWSARDLQECLAWCATGLHLGWDEHRAFQVGEAMVMEKRFEGIRWPEESQLTDDMEAIRAYSSRGNNISPSRTTKNTAE